MNAKCLYGFDKASRGNSWGFLLCHSRALICKENPLFLYISGRTCKENVIFCLMHNTLHNHFDSISPAIRSSSATAAAITVLCPINRSINDRFTAIARMPSTINALFVAILLPILPLSIAQSVEYVGNGRRHQFVTNAIASHISVTVTHLAVVIAAYRRRKGRTVWQFPRKLL